MGDRCPRCGGALKPGAQWCGLCYADLRPPPPAPAPPAQPAAPVFAPVATAQTTDAVDGASAGADSAGGEGSAGPGAPKKGWPCLECGAVNPFELEACVACGMPFGSALRTPAPTLPGDRRTRIGIAVAIAALLMGLIALLSIATGGEQADQPDPPAEITVDG